VRRLGWADLDGFRYWIYKWAGVSTTILIMDGIMAYGMVWYGAISSGFALCDGWELRWSSLYANGKSIIETRLWVLKLWSVTNLASVYLTH
jgi:hypothetical protein